MSLILPDCIKCHDTRPECVVSERGKTYRLQNRSGFEIRIVRVDGCLANIKRERRCDYLMNIDKCRRAIFIELKGGALVDAIQQIYSTVLYLKEEFKRYQLDARIVGKGDVPGFINLPEYRKLAKELGKSNGKIERSTTGVYLENV